MIETETDDRRGGKPRADNRGSRAPLRILVVEDSADDAALILRTLRSGGYETCHERVETPEAMRQALRDGRWDAIISDHAMPRFDAPAALEVLRGSGLDLPFIIVSGEIGEDAAVAAMRAGAHDYVIKGNLRRLCPAVEREIREAGERRERRRSDAALRQSEQLYRMVIEQSSECIFLVDARSRRLLEANDAFRELLGYTPEELEGMTVYDLIAHDRASVDENIRLVLEKGRHDIGERRYRRKDGTLVDVEVRGNTILLGGREVMCYVWRDITGRKRAEEALRMSETRFRSVIEQSSLSIQILSPDGWTLRVNRAWEELWGVTLDDLAGYNMLEDQQLVTKGIMPYIRRGFAGEPAAIPPILYDPNETIPDLTGHEELRRWVRAFIYPVKDEAGNVREVTLMHEDITERKRAEEALRESEERFRTLADNMSQLAWMADERGWIFWYNKRWFDYTGTTLEEMRGWGWRSVHHPEHVDRVVERLQRSWDTGEPWEDTFPLRGKDGAYRWFLSRAMPIRDGEGRIVRWFGTNTDVTEQREAEEEVRQLNEQLEQRVRRRTAELAEANKELESFSYSVSHDLRAPLRHIGGFANLLQRKAAPALDETGLHYVDVIVESAKQAGKLIDDLLAFSRMGRAEMRRAAVDMDRLVREARDELKFETEGRRISWKIGDLPEVEGDPSLLRLVVENLLSNAVKYTRVRDEAEIEVGGERGVEETIFSVRDNGAGFDMEYANKLFGVFQRLHRAEDFEGTGIGLANVRRIIQRHGGHVRAEGAVDEGATFFFSLPHTTTLGRNHGEPG